jgi:hypothetical protein
MPVAYEDGWKHVVTDIQNCVFYDVRPCNLVGRNLWFSTDRHPQILTDRQPQFHTNKADLHRLVVNDPAP